MSSLSEFANCSSSFIFLVIPKLPVVRVKLVVDDSGDCVWFCIQLPFQSMTTFTQMVFQLFQILDTGGVTRISLNDPDQ